MTTFTQYQAQRHLDLVLAPVFGSDSGRITRILPLVDLARFGVRTLAQFQDLVPRDFVERYFEFFDEEDGENQWSLRGLLIEAMLIRDPARYFNAVYDGAWSSLTERQVALYDRCGIQFRPVFDQFGIATPEQFCAQDAIDGYARPNSRLKTVPTWVKPHALFVERARSKICRLCKSPCAGNGLVVAASSSPKDEVCDGCALVVAPHLFRLTQTHYTARDFSGMRPKLGLALRALNDDGVVVENEVVADAKRIARTSFEPAFELLARHAVKSLPEPFSSEIRRLAKIIMNTCVAAGETRLEAIPYHARRLVGGISLFDVAPGDLDTKAGRRLLVRVAKDPDLQTEELGRRHQLLWRGVQKQILIFDHERWKSEYWGRLVPHFVDVKNGGGS